ncbi:MAG: hypothetical protein GY927_21505 [bacterium]|nr:hypothetical protein [bacterium]
MDTPEKDNFLDTIRELRKEADEKLIGNRHYMAIQKLDEIAEAVQERDMSSAELSAVSEVLRGDGGEAPVAATKEPVAQALDTQNINPNAQQVLPNWWKDREVGCVEGELEAVQPAIESEIETVSESAPESVVENVEESGLDLTSVATGAAVTGVAAAMVADQLSSETAETGEIAEEIELIEIPEVEIEPVDAALPAINIEAIEPEIDLSDVAEVEMSEVVLEAAPKIEEPDIETIAVPEIEPVVEIAEVSEAVEIAAIPEVAPEPVELVVEEIPEAVIEVVPEETVIPEVEIAAIPDIPAPDESAQIADLLSDVDVDTQAVVAAGAAAAAIGTAGIVMQDEETAPQEVKLVEQPSDEIGEAHEKQSFPSVPEASEHVETQPEMAAAIPAATILNGDSISQHHTYGGNRGGILKRFFNSLRGKDYI